MRRLDIELNEQEISEHTGVGETISLLEIIELKKKWDSGLQDGKEVINKIRNSMSEVIGINREPFILRMLCIDSFMDVTLEEKDGGVEITREETKIE